MKLGKLEVAYSPGNSQDSACWIVKERQKELYYTTIRSAVKYCLHRLLAMKHKAAGDAESLLKAIKAAEKTVLDAVGQIEEEMRQPAAAASGG